MTFKNPRCSDEEEAGCPFFWCFLFGSFYLLFKGAWGHALFSAGLALATSGFSWFIYPFFAGSIVRARYLRRGWIEV